MLRKNTCRLSHSSWTLFTSSWSSISAEDSPDGVRTGEHQTPGSHPCRNSCLQSHRYQTRLVGIESPLFPCARVRIASVSTSTALSLSCWCSCWSKVAREALENLAAPHRASPGLWADVTQSPSRLWEPLLVKDKSVDRSPCVHAARQEFKSVQKAVLLRAAAPWTEMHLVTPVL